VDCLVVGTGAVAEKYAAGFGESSLALAAVCDRDADRAASFAADRDVPAYGDLDAMLAAEPAPLVVNLTSHGAHAAVTRRCLEAGRHVFSEKPLALDAATARELLGLAADQSLGLDCAPISPRCDAQRHAASFLADGRLGPVRLVYAHAHVGRVTEWHDRPSSFLSVGPLYDGAVYPLSLLVAWFGPVDRVRTADGVAAWPERETATPGRAPHVEATLSFAGGPVLSLRASLYASHRAREFNSLELHGDDGALYLADAGALAADRDVVSVRGGRRPYTVAPHPRPRRERRYLAGPERLARSAADADGPPPLAGARRAAHVVAVCEAIERVAETGDPRTVPRTGATADRPAPPAVRPPGDGGTVDRPLPLPPVGFGCSRYRDGDYVDRVGSVATALDAGYRLFDSAELYGNEARIGDLLARPGSPDREHLFLASKVWNTNHEHVAEACEGTLDELGVDALDCYLLHWPEAFAYRGPLRRLADLPPDLQESLAFPETGDGERATVDVPLTETWRRLEAVHERGLTRSVGLCNVGVAQLDAVWEAARIEPAVVQIERHPYRPQTDVVAWCRERDVRVVAHSPLSAPGLLDDPTVVDVAAAHDASPAAVLLAWHVQRGVVPIPSSTHPDHVVENLAAARLRLSEAGLAALDGLADPSFER
jgi:alcohol dehydrogenase (NADP+)